MAVTYLFEFFLLVLGLPLDGDLDSYTYQLLMEGNVVQIELVDDGWGYDALLYPVNDPEDSLEIDVEFIDNGLYNLVIPEMGEEYVFDFATVVPEMQWEQAPGDVHEFSIPDFGDYLQYFDGDNHFLSALDQGMMLVISHRYLRKD